MVWGAFGAAMALACGVLVLGDSEAPRPIVLMAPMLLGATDAGVMPREVPLDRARWNAIVIHHSGTPAGDAATIARMHNSEGLAGLGYHFLVGNGQGIADGFVQVCPRWNQQLPGAHVAARKRSDGSTLVNLQSDTTADQLNLHAVGICLIGNGDRRPFTPQQLHELGSLVRRLQRELGIPAERVFLHSDVAGVASPGKFFPTSEFEGQLLQASR